MVKDSDGRSASVGVLFLFRLIVGGVSRRRLERASIGRRQESPPTVRIFNTSRKGESMTKQTKKAVIAYRKTCPAKGTGLSHYILMDKKAK